MNAEAEQENEGNEDMDDYDDEEMLGGGGGGGGEDDYDDMEEGGEALETFDCSEFFSKSKMLERLDEQIQSNCQEKDYQNKHKVDLEDNLCPIDVKNHYSLINEYDWKKCAPQYVFGIAEYLAKNPKSETLYLYEITNESFFDQVCEYIKRRINYQND